MHFKYLESKYNFPELFAPASGESRKLEPKYRDPFVVKNVLENDRYQISDLSDNQRIQRSLDSVFATDKQNRFSTLGPGSTATVTGINPWNIYYKSKTHFVKTFQ